MQQTKKQKNIEMLIEFIKNNPDGCSTAQMRDQLEKVNISTKPITLRTIQTYMKDLKEDYVKGVEPIEVHRGFYKIIDRRSPISQMAIEHEKRIYLKLAVESMEELSDFSKHHDQIVKDLKLCKVSTAYYVKPENYEKLNTSEEEIKLLEEAILKKYIISFDYRDDIYIVEAYRMVNFDGIWYLYGKDTQERRGNPYKTWMLEFIDKVEVDYTHHHNISNETIEEHLDDADSAAFVPGKAFTVKVKVSSEVAHIFKRRKHLPEQSCLFEKDGSLIATSVISTYDDIDPEIKSWLPHIEILEPLEYRERFLLELESYRNKFQNEIERLSKTI